MKPTGTEKSGEDNSAMFTPAGIFIELVKAIPVSQPSGAALYAKPNERLIHLFEKTFPDAKNIKWNEDANGYVVCFAQSNMLNKITYDNNDNFVSSLRYYDETNLPANILLAIKKKFAGKTIFGVTEFTNIEGVIYSIKLKDEKKWYTVQATSDGNFEVKESYKIQTENLIANYSNHCCG
ncbi:MAG: hypothetical protein ACR2FN_00710 [Chitinophagaceae bacterium]